MGFHRIRHYGLFANGNRAESIAKARELLAVPPPSKKPEGAKVDQTCALSHPCPCCGGRMLIIETFAPGSEPRHRPNATPPSIRFVPIKSAEQQAAQMLHRTRDLLTRQRTQLINAMRGHLGELGLVAPKGREGLQQLLRAVAQAEEEQLPSDARFACEMLIAQLQAVQGRIDALEKRIHQAHRANPASRRLDAIPGFGVIVSSAVVATMTDPKAFKTGREFAAWIGLVPRQNSTGGKERLGSISKQGDRYLRRLLIVGALAVIKSARTRPDKYPWVVALLGRRPAKVVAVALANKMARIAWAVLVKGETYRAPTRTSSGALTASG